MRILLTLLLLSFLCTSVRAQNITVTASIALADDHCNPVINNPNTDCSVVPDGTDMLTYLPGQDGDIIVTYRIENLSSSTITEGELVDSDRGTIIPLMAVSIPPNTTLTRNRVYPAETVPRTVTSTITATISNGVNTRTIEGEYTLDVVSPQLGITEFGIGRTKNNDVCAESDLNPECFSLDGTTSITIGAKDSVSAYFRWQNTGLSIIDNLSFDDSNVAPNEGIVESDRPQDLDPNEISFGTAFFVAPDLPGTYNRTLTLTSTDLAGNTSTTTQAYKLIVTAPELGVIAFGIGRTKNLDVCAESDLNPVCFSLDGTTSITLGARDSVSAYFRWQNIGDGIIDNLAFDDSNVAPNEGIVESDRPQDLDPNEISFGTAFFLAPDLPGTYNRTLTFTSTDLAGNTSTTTATYTLIVTPPDLDITAFGIGRTKNSDVCLESDLNPVCFTLDGTTSITVGARDSISTYFRWQNIGDGIIDNLSFDDSNVAPNEGIVESDRPQDLDPNEISFGTAFFVAPDLPGVYNRTLTFTSTDLAGNTSTTTATYQLIVTAPDLDITEFGIGRTKNSDVCAESDLNPVCFSLDGTTSITVGAHDSISTYFRWQNVGDGIIDNLAFDDSNIAPNEGIVESDRPQDLDPNEISFGTAFFVAPDLPGTYIRTLTLSFTDLGGNTRNTGIVYTLIVTAPELDITEFGIGRTKDPAVCAESDLNPVCFSLDGTTSITVGARDSVSAYFRWQNVGDGIIDRLAFDDSNVAPNEGIVESDRPQDLDPNEISFGTAFFVSPDEPGTYNRTLTITSTDFGGNMTTTQVPYTLIVDCGVADFAPPVARCQDRSFTILDGETQDINAGMINDGSSDGCGALAGGSINISSFSCIDEGPNTVTLTVGDLTGNSASCTATVTINVDDAIYEGPNGTCVSTDAAVAGGQAWYDITSPSGKIIAQVIIGANTNIVSVKADIYKSAAMTESVIGHPYLSKRISLRMIGAGGTVVQPNNEPVYVRLYYTEAEIDALMAASPGSSPASFTIIKTSGIDCGSGYSGVNATEMNTSFNGTGCAGEDGYFEFFTGSFSSFYLFANDATLPVELTSFEARAIEKQRVQLDWATATESGSSHFEVEHSTDGRNFTYLGAVAGAGDAFQEQRYAFLHETPAEGTNYYRLRQVDLDGTATLSEVREVTFSSTGQLSVFPNPTTEELSVKGFAGGPVRVLDLQGRTVLEQTLPEFGTLRVTELPAGIYLLLAGEETLRWVKR